MTVVEVWELPWDDKVGHDISVVDVDISEVLVEGEEKGKVDVDRQFKHNVCYVVEVYDDFLEGDDLYIVDEVESNGATHEIEMDVRSSFDVPVGEMSDLHIDEEAPGADHNEDALAADHNEDE